MNQDQKQKVSSSFSQAAKTLRSLLLSMWKIYPGFVIAGSFLAMCLVWVTIQSAAFMTGTAVLLILVVSLGVFAIRGNFGEALLSLVGGLMSVFSYEWTPERYFAFSVAWIGFALFALLIVGLKLAIKHEDIYRQAAIRMAGPDANSEEWKQLEKQLEAIADSASTLKLMGPTERAEAIRLFAYRGLRKELFAAAIRATEALSVITKCDDKRVAIFVADFFQSMHPQNDLEATRLTDSLYMAIQTTPVPPEEFFSAFEKSRRLMVSQLIPPMVFLDALQTSLSKGTALDDVPHDIETEISRR